MHVRQSGFTLIELLVVIGMIGVLAAVLVVAINPIGQLQRGRDLQRESNINSLQTYLEQYRHDQGAYPTPVSGGYTLGSCNSALTGGTPAVTYTTSIPCDPKISAAYYNAGSYYYNVDANGNYTLAACLENTSPTSNTPNVTSTAPNPAPSVTGTCASYYVVQNQ